MIKPHGSKTLLNVKVSPRKSCFGFESVDEWAKALNVKTTNSPKKGKANKELVKELKKFFNAEVKIVKGEKSRNKTVLISLPMEKVREKLL